MKKIRFLIVFTVFYVAICATQAQNFCGGNGTKDTPYLICNAQQLNLIRNYLSAPDIYFQLSNNIDLAGWNGETGWIPIGNNEKRFQGSLNGNGYEIKNLVIPKGSKYVHAGLFGVIENATIKNLNVEANIDMSDLTLGECHSGAIFGTAKGSENKATSISECSSSGSIVGGWGSYTYNGGIGGSCEGFVTISDCKNNGSVNGGAGFYDSYSAGICGFCFSYNQQPISILRCKNDGAISGGWGSFIYVGGLCGYAKSSGFSYGDGNISISFCGNDGSITGGWASYVGGICGYGNVYNSGDIKISNCENNGYITVGLGACSGGVCGYGNIVDKGSFAIENNYATGDIFSTNYNTGGLMGFKYGDISFKNSFFDVKTTEIKKPVGNDISIAVNAGKTTAEMKKQETFAGWDFVETWNIWENNSYPYFQWQSAQAKITKNSPTDITGSLRSDEGNIFDSVALYKITQRNSITHRLGKAFIDNNQWNFSPDESLAWGDTLMIVSYEKGGKWSSYFMPSKIQENSAIDLLDNQKNMLRIFPNPTFDGQLTVEIESKNDATIEIYTVTGKLIETHPTEGEKTAISIAHLPSGTYLFKVGLAVSKINKL